MRGLTRSLILQESIVTTIAKAKSLRPYVEKLVTASKAPSVASRRVTLQRIGSSEAVKKLHNDIAKRFEKRTGGYTRITRLGRIGTRVGEQARIEFLK